MKRKLVSVLLSAAMVSTLLAGCGGSDTSTSGSATSTTGDAAAADTEVSTGEEDHVIRIGAICAMTGGSAIYGEGAQNAIDMAVEEINSAGGDYTVEIVNGGKVADDAKDSKQAVNAYNSVMADDPEAVVGSFFSATTLPMAELANEDGMLLLATGATNKDVTLIGPSIFRDCFIDPYQGKMAALFAADQGATKAAIIYAKDDDYSNGLKDAFVENAEADGIEVVYTGECTTTDTDFTAQVSQAVASGADYLFYPCFLDTVPLLVQQARDAGFEGIIMGGDGWDGSDTTGLESEFENCYFTNHYSSEDTAEAVKTNLNTSLCTLFNHIAYQECHDTFVLVIFYNFCHIGAIICFTKNNRYTRNISCYQRHTKGTNNRIRNKTDSAVLCIWILVIHIFQSFQDLSTNCSCKSCIQSISQFLFIGDQAL